MGYLRCYITEERMSTATVQKQIGAPWEREVEELFGEHYAFLYRAARRVLLEPADAEDVVQSLFLKFVQGLR